MAAAVDGVVVVGVRRRPPADRLLLRRGPVLGADHSRRRHDVDGRGRAAAPRVDLRVRRQRLGARLRLRERGDGLDLLQQRALRDPLGLRDAVHAGLRASATAPGRPVVRGGARQRDGGGHGAARGPQQVAAAVVGRDGHGCGGHGRAGHGGAGLRPGRRRHVRGRQLHHRAQPGRVAQGRPGVPRRVPGLDGGVDLLVQAEAGRPGARVEGAARRPARARWRLHARRRPASLQPGRPHREADPRPHVDHGRRATRRRPSRLGAHARRRRRPALPRRTLLARRAWHGCRGAAVRRTGRAAERTRRQPVAAAPERHRGRPRRFHR